jgi:hypothetical protein
VAVIGYYSLGRNAKKDNEIKMYSVMTAIKKCDDKKIIFLILKILFLLKILDLI